MTIRPFAALLLLLALTACETPIDMSPPGGYADPYDPAVNNPQIQVLSSDLRPWLAFQTATTLRGDGAPIAVQVPVRNVTDNQYLVDYRFVFFDENGVVVEPQMGWTFQALDPRQTVAMRGNALDTRAVDWRLEVQWSR